MKTLFLKKLIGFNSARSSFLILTIAAMIIHGCKKEEDNTEEPITPKPGTTEVVIEQKNKALLMDISGTWCGPCGAYGIPTFNMAIQKAGEKVLPLAIHVSDPLTLAAMNDVANLPRFFTNSVPRIVTGNGLIFPAGVPVDTVGAANKIVLAADTFIANNNVTAGVELRNLKVDQGNISVDVFYKFFETTSNSYQLAVYFVEDNVVSPQAISGKPKNMSQVHNHVIRAVSGSSAFGEPMNVGSSLQTQKVSASFNQSWNSSNMHAVAIIWKKGSGGDFLYVNGNVSE